VLPGSRARIVRCGGRYDPQLVKRSSEWVSECVSYSTSAHAWWLYKSPMVARILTWFHWSLVICCFGELAPCWVSTVLGRVAGFATWRLCDWVVSWLAPWLSSVTLYLIRESAKCVAIWLERCGPVVGPLIYFDRCLLPDCLTIWRTPIRALIHTVLYLFAINSVFEFNLFDSTVLYCIGTQSILSFRLIIFDCLLVLYIELYISLYFITHIRRDSFIALGHLSIQNKIT